MEVHPAGEGKTKLDQQFPSGIFDTYGGEIRIEWAPSAKATAFGPVSYFIPFLQSSGVWDQWVALCALHFTSSKAPSKEKILATILVSVLAGHKRYAHISAIRADKVLPELLGERSAWALPGRTGSSGGHKGRGWCDLRRWAGRARADWGNGGCDW